MNQFTPRPEGVKVVADLPTYDARDLVGNGVQAKLILDDQVYLLRVTRAGKLILTK